MSDIKPNKVLGNNTGNRSRRAAGNVVIGQHLDADGFEQSVFGRHNSMEGDASTDIFQVGGGGGGDEISKRNSIRVKEDGEVTIQGGNVFTETEEGQIIPVVMEGSDGRIKFVFMD